MLVIIHWRSVVCVQEFVWTQPKDGPDLTSIFCSLRPGVTDYVQHYQYTYVLCFCVNSRMTDSNIIHQVDWKKKNPHVYTVKLPKPARTGTRKYGRFRGVVGFVRLHLQRIVCQGLKKSANIQGGPVFWGSGLEKFHCTTNSLWKDSSIKLHCNTGQRKPY
jgi:hypothetical protein